MYKWVKNVFALVRTVQCGGPRLGVVTKNEKEKRLRLLH